MSLSCCALARDFHPVGDPLHRHVEDAGGGPQDLLTTSPCISSFIRGRWRTALARVTPRAYNQRMRNLNLHITVPADRRVVVQLPEEVDPGEADITIIVRKRQAARAETSVLDRLPSLSVGPWPQGTTFSRSEMYGDDER